MRGRWLFLFLVICGVNLAFSRDFCDKLQRTKVSDGEVIAGGALKSSDGTTFKNGTFWRDGKFWWACPCLNGPCVRQCYTDLAIKYNVMTKEKSTRIKIWDDGVEKEVDMEKHFGVVYDALCYAPTELKPDIEVFDEFLMYPNGSIYFPHPEIPAEHRLISDAMYCLIPIDEENQTILTCSKEEEQKQPSSNMRFIIYPVFYILSAICLLLTLIAFVLTPERNSFHSKSVACQSGCLLVSFLGLAITYLTGEKSNEKICVNVAYIMHFFLMASFFWMNVMCIDIYLTFSGSMLQMHKGSFRVFSLYAWCAPLAFSAVTIILDKNTNDLIWSPGIGDKSCWFRDFWPNFVYFNGPLLILLTINAYLFGVTVWRLRQKLKETRGVLRRSDSQVHNRNERNRLILYVKLFMLTGFTWIFESISWAVGGREEYWYLTDSINNLRGVFIFWFCVLSDKTMRYSLKQKFWIEKKKKLHILTKVEPQSGANHTSSTSTVV
ncbi:G-protein coupled receptor Mth-like [Neocloeon triangulifer]|uniref:G-protein coupled receptor Mth-like n=1 Tax=Neocloeon triangulifer TaxID=2078957 RepID=UPI00286F2CC0|nr:G-protein coupled receptor Mth-like [Neocloeon triangulifer]